MGSAVLRLHHLSATAWAVLRIMRLDTTIRTIKTSDRDLRWLTIRDSTMDCWATYSERERRLSAWVERSCTIASRVSPVLAWIRIPSCSTRKLTIHFRRWRRIRDLRDTRHFPADFCRLRRV